jgi:hypothetical protein
MQPLGELLASSCHRGRQGEGGRFWVEGGSGWKLRGASNYMARGGGGQCWGLGSE